MKQKLILENMFIEWKKIKQPKRTFPSAIEKKKKRKQLFSSWLL